MLALHGLLHLLGYDHERDDGRMARLEARLRRKGGLRAGSDRAAVRPHDSDSLAVPARRCATIFLGTVQTAFSALMRLSLRLMAERGGRDDRLGHYLDDPLQLFVPVAASAWPDHCARRGRCIARLSGVQRRPLSRRCSSCRWSAFVVVCEHLLPMLIVRRNPEAVLDVLLPPFDPVAQLLTPLTGALVRWLASGVASATPPDGSADAAQRGAGEADRDRGGGGDLPSEEERGCCSRSSTSATRSCARS